jgi:cell division FtsZ-interacting protein ZapD
LTVYEYPFNERIRTLLRLEDLYEKFSFFIQHDHPLQHHVALATIYEMLEVSGRADLKSDLLQELERQKQTLIGFKANPNVEASRLDAILSDIEKTSAASVPCHAANASSNSQCGRSPPLISRDAPAPVPWRRNASTAASTMKGSAASPR